MSKKIYLYKYRPDNTYTIKLLCEQRLHFSHPYDFNDPFDCKPLCPTDISDEDIMEQLKRDCQPWFVELMNSNIDKVRAMWRNGKVQNTIDKTLNWNYICCFSYNADIPAMWAHYAQDHSGICLGFDTVVKSPFLEGINGIVKYVDERTILNWAKIGTDNSDTKSFFFEKSKVWEYEQEYRVVKPHLMVEQFPDTYNSFKKEALVAMFFGLKMPKERQDFYINLCKLCGLNNVTFFKMTMPKDGSFHLLPQQIYIVICSYLP